MRVKITTQNGQTLGEVDVPNDDLGSNIYFETDTGAHFSVWIHENAATLGANADETDWDESPTGTLDLADLARRQAVWTDPSARAYPSLEDA